MTEAHGGRRGAGVVIAVLVVVLIAVAVVLAVTRDYTPEPSQAGGGQVQDSRIGTDLFAAGERKPLPELTGQDLDGKPLSTSDYPGDILVINLWGSWCAPCRAEAPDLAQESMDTQDSGVQFLGIDTRDNAAAGRAFSKRFEISYPSFDESATTVLLELAGVVPLSAVPSTVFVDAEGEIAARVIGQVDGSTLRGIVDDLIAERDAGPSTS